MSKRELVLSLLEANEWVFTNDFLNAGCGSRFGARVQELRDRGHVIHCERVRDGQSRYQLRSAVDKGCRGLGNPDREVRGDLGVAGSPAPRGDGSNDISLACASVAVISGVSSPGAEGTSEPSGSGAPRLFEVEEPFYRDEAA